MGQREPLRMTPKFLAWVTEKMMSQSTDGKGECWKKNLGEKNDVFLVSYTK